MGQQKYFVGADVLGIAQIEPDTPLGFTYIQLQNTGETALLVWTKFGWAIISAYGATVL